MAANATTNPSQLLPLGNLGRGTGAFKLSVGGQQAAAEVTLSRVLGKCVDEVLYLSAVRLWAPKSLWPRAAVAFSAW